MKVVDTTDGRVLLVRYGTKRLDVLAEQYGADFVVLLTDDLDPETYPMEAVELAVAILQKAEGVTSQ